MSIKDLRITARCVGRKRARVAEGYNLTQSSWQAAVSIARGGPSAKAKPQGWV